MAIFDGNNNPINTNMTKEQLESLVKDGLIKPIVMNTMEERKESKDVANDLKKVIENFADVIKQAKEVVELAKEGYKAKPVKAIGGGGGSGGLTKNIISPLMKQEEKGLKLDQISTKAISAFSNAALHKGSIHIAGQEQSLKNDREMINLWKKFNDSERLKNESGTSRFRQQLFGQDVQKTDKEGKISYEKAGFKGNFGFKGDPVTKVADAIKSITEGISLDAIFKNTLKGPFDYMRSMRKIAYQTEGILGTTKSLQKPWDMVEQSVERTGVDRIELEKALMVASKKGMKSLKDTTKVSVAGLYVSKQIGSNAEHTAELFNDWHMNLGMSSDTMNSMTGAMRNVARSTGVTGDALIGAAKSTEQILKNMRNTGQLTAQSAEMMIQMTAQAKKMGVETEVQALQAAITSGSRAKFLKETGNFNKLMISQAAQSGKMSLDKAVSGSMNPEETKRLYEGMKEFAGTFSGNITNIEDFKKLTGEQQDSINGLIYAQSEGLYAGLPQFLTAIEAMNPKTFTDQLKELNEESNKNLRPDERVKLEVKRSDLISNQAAKALDEFSRQLNDNSLENVLKSGGTLEKYINDNREGIESALKLDSGKSKGMDSSKIMQDLVKVKFESLEKLSEASKVPLQAGIKKQIDELMKSNDPAKMRDGLKMLTDESMRVGSVTEAKTDATSEMEYYAKVANDKAAGLVAEGLVFVDKNLSKILKVLTDMFGIWGPIFALVGIAGGATIIGLLSGLAAGIGNVLTAVLATIFPKLAKLFPKFGGGGGGAGAGAGGLGGGGGAKVPNAKTKPSFRNEVTVPKDATANVKKSIERNNAKFAKQEANALKSEGATAAGKSAASAEGKAASIATKAETKAAAALAKSEAKAAGMALKAEAKAASLAAKSEGTALKAASKLKGGGKIALLVGAGLVAGSLLTSWWSKKKNKEEEDSPEIEPGSELDIIAKTVVKIYKWLKECGIGGGSNKLPPPPDSASVVGPIAAVGAMGLIGTVLYKVFKAANALNVGAKAAMAEEALKATKAAEAAKAIKDAKKIADAASAAKKPGLWSKTKSFFDRPKSYIKKLFKDTIVKPLSTSLKPVTEPVSKFFKNTKASSLEKGKKALDTGRNFLKPFTNFMGEKFAAVRTFFGKNFVTPFNNVIGWVGKKWETVRNIVKPVIDFVKNGIIAPTKGFFSRIGSFISEKASKHIKTPIAKSVGWIGEKITEKIISPLAKKAAPYVLKLSKALEPIVSPVIRTASKIIEPTIRTATKIAAPLVKYGAPALKIFGKVLGPIIGGAVGAWEAKEEGYTTTQGIGLGLATGGSRTGSLVTDIFGKEGLAPVLNIEKDSMTDYGLGLAGAGAVGASTGTAIAGAITIATGGIGAPLIPIFAGIGAAVGTTTEAFKIISKETANAAKWNAETFKLKQEIPNMMVDNANVAIKEGDKERVNTEIELLEEQLKLKKTHAEIEQTKYNKRWFKKGEGYTSGEGARALEEVDRIQGLLDSIKAQAAKEGLEGVPANAVPTASNHDQEIRNQGAELGNQLAQKLWGANATVPANAVHTVPANAVPTVPANAVPTVPANAVPTVPANAVPTVPANAVPTVPANAVPTVPANAVPTVPANAVPTVPAITSASMTDTMSKALLNQQLGMMTGDVMTGDTMSAKSKELPETLISNATAEENMRREQAGTEQDSTQISSEELSDIAKYSANLNLLQDILNVLKTNNESSNYMSELTGQNSDPMDSPVHSHKPSSPPNYYRLAGGSFSQGPGRQVSNSNWATG